MNKNASASITDRLISAGSYASMGFLGAIWMVLCAIRRIEMPSFLKYHVFQSIFLSLTLYILNLLLGILLNILSVIPLIKTLARQIVYLFNVPVLYGYSIIQSLIYALLIYLIITSLLGLYSYVPFISNVISDNFNRK